MSRIIEGGKEEQNPQKEVYRNCQKCRTPNPDGESE
jgi:hypothetical protein